MPEYRLSVDITARVFMNKIRISENQAVMYGSLEDPDDTSGIEAPNNGYFESIHVEEPISTKLGKAPTDKGFRKSLDIIEDSVKRANERHNAIFVDELKLKEPIEKTTTWITCNLWDDGHPITEWLEESIPEKEFLKFMTGVEDIWELTKEEIEELWSDIYESIFKNHTLARYEDRPEHPNYDTLFVKLSKFANPMERKNKEELEPNIKRAILARDKNALAILLGLVDTGDREEGKTYDTRRVQMFDPKTIFDSFGDYEIKGASGGWDIDINKQLVFTPVYWIRWRPKDSIQWYQNLLMFDQVKVKAYGAGVIGENNPRYEDMMADATIQAQKELSKRNIKLNLRVSMDDDRKIYLFSTMNKIKQKGYNIGIALAKKHAEWNILKRQSWLQNAMDSGALWISKNNQVLLAMLDKSVRKEGQKNRDESGRLANFYDEINSAEYALYSLHAVAYRKDTGSIPVYKGDEDVKK